MKSFVCLIFAQKIYCQHRHPLSLNILVSIEIKHKIQKKKVSCGVGTINNSYIIVIRKLTTNYF